MSKICQVCRQSTRELNEAIYQRHRSDGKMIYNIFNWQTMVAIVLGFYFFGTIIICTFIVMFGWLFR